MVKHAKLLYNKLVKTIMKPWNVCDITFYTNLDEDRNNIAINVLVFQVGENSCRFRKTSLKHS